MSVFKQSCVSFRNLNQQQISNMLGGVTQEVAFCYINQDLSLAFENSAASGIPPVHELFAGFIGCYRYTDSSLGKHGGAGPPLLSGKGNESLSFKYRPIREDLRTTNSNAVLHTVAEGESKQDEREFDSREIETVLDHCDDWNFD